MKYSSVLAIMAVVSFMDQVVGQNPGRFLAGAPGGQIIAFNTDVSNGYNLAPYDNPNGCFLNPGSAASFPSVAQNGTIAFTRRDAAGQNAQRVFLMNADGTNVRQITFADATGAEDVYPSISPDGTKVAFLSNRAVFNGNHYQEAFVVNSDSSGLHEVTPVSTDANGNTGDLIQNVAWSSDSTTLAFKGFRYSNICDAGFGFVGLVGTIKADGTGETQLACVNAAHSSSANALDWSPDGTSIAFGLAYDSGGNLANGIEIISPTGAFKYGLTMAQLGWSTGCGGQHCIHFSPDSTRLAYENIINGFCGISIINLNGTGRADSANVGYGPDNFWWAAGAAIPAPASLTLGPNPVQVWPGHAQQLLPNLLDANGNVITHAAQGYCQMGPFCASIGPSGLVSYVNTNTTTLNVTNGGLTSNMATLQCLAQAPAPILTVSRTKLNFGYSGSLASQITSPQTVTVSITGGVGVGWIVSSDHPNVTVSPTSGTDSGTFQVTAAPPSGAGSGGAIITVSAPGASGSPQQIQVNVTSVTATMPFGSFDTPVNNTSGIAGAVGVTGWALDSIEVTNVGIWREPVPGEATAPNGLVFIGDANFVADARPDVAATFPSSPYQYRGGFGYLMLTNFLRNSAGSGPLGNGTYKLHVIVTNKSGTAVDLGVRTITVDNAHASKPFGTIDTPGQGGSATGTAFVNFGWALTQNPFAISFDGSTITVILDGVPMGHPVYNQFRSDIANLFPGLANSNGAVGFDIMDTTKFKNGVHTISWNVFDNTGHGDGVGSRYFTVFNVGGGVAAPEDLPAPESLAGPVQLRSGYDLNAPQVALALDISGSYSVEMEQLGRIELSLGAAEGYLVVGDEAEDLPLGSTLKAGVLYWQAPLGFLGKYELLFERPDGKQTRVRVNIVPKQYSLQ